MQANFEDEEGYLAEDDFAEFDVLVYITQVVDTPRLDLLECEGFRVLRVEYA